MHLKMLSTKVQPFFLCLNEITELGSIWHHQITMLLIDDDLVTLWGTLSINTKMLFYQYRKSQCGDKMVIRMSYLFKEIFLVKWHLHIEIDPGPLFIKWTDVLSREVSKQRDLMLSSLYHSEMWQTPRQQCCWGACLISEWLKKSKPKDCSFKTSWDLKDVRPLNE